MKRTLIPVVSDPHGGHKLGLCNPETIIEDDSMGEVQKISPILNEAQTLLWEVYSNGIDEVAKLAGKDEVLLILSGDVTQGNKYISEQMTTRIADQFFIAEYNLHPWIHKVKNIKTIRLAKGTGSHEFGEGSSSLTVSRLIKNKFPKIDIKSLYHGLIRTKGGVFIDYAHHGPYPGSRNWLKGNEARYYLKSLMMDEVQAGHVPPHIVIRGHYHQYIKEYYSLRTNGTEYESWLTVVPSMDMMSDFAIQASRSSYRITNGIVVYELIDNKVYDIHFFGTTTDVRTYEEM